MRGLLLRAVAIVVATGGMVTAVVGASPGMASVAAHRPLRPGVPAVAGSGPSLGQAQAGLRAAVHRALGVPAAGAGSAFQQAKLTATGGAANDFFGWSVATSGSTAVVGAPGIGSATGAAYVFVRSGTTWSQQAKLTDPGGVAGDEFGYSVAIAGSTVVVGAPGRNSFTGTAYVFVPSGTTWSQQAELADPGAAAYDYFGASVATTGSTVVVGADESGNSGAGAAYVFVRSGSTWSQQAKLTAAGGAAGDLFGTSVAISGSTVVVGASGTNSGAGAAYVFARFGITWSQQAKLTAAGGAANDSFGGSVAISGSTVVVGASGTKSDTGAAYLFARSGTTWSQQPVLTDPGGAAGDDFGYSVAITGSTAVIGTPGFNGSGMGAAYTFTRSGTTWSQQTKLTGGAAGDDFGRSVAITGSTVVAGADGSNSATGAAYVFVLPSQQAELTHPGGAAGDKSGWSVAISGSTAVVGAPYYNSQAGAAYVFTRSGTTWSQQATLTDPGGAGGDLFGYSVAISGSTAVVGAPYYNSQAGAAYVFTRSGTTWSQQATLTDPGGAGGDLFGYSVAISGSTAVVGAPYYNSQAGAAYVFTRSGTTWSQQATLTDPGGAGGDLFGYSVAISGSTAVVGADGSNSQTGAAYVFVRSGTAWSQQAMLTAADATAGDLFGDSVAISGSTAVVGAPYHNSQTGAAYVFVRSGTAWSQQAELADSGGAAGDYLGHSVAISGSTVVVGADEGGNSGAGAAYVYARSGTAWSQQAGLTDPGGVGGDVFGDSVAISGSTVMVGAPGNNVYAGAAYVYTRSGTTWGQQAKLTDPGGVTDDYFGYLVAIAKSTAVMGAPGRNSQSGAAYVFVNV